MTELAFRVSRGEPDADELAALVASLTALTAAAASAPEPPPTVSAWADRARLLGADRLDAWS